MSDRSVGDATSEPRSAGTADAGGAEADVPDANVRPSVRSDDAGEAAAASADARVEAAADDRPPADAHAEGPDAERSAQPQASASAAADSTTDARDAHATGPDAERSAPSRAFASGEADSIADARDAHAIGPDAERSAQPQASAAGEANSTTAQRAEDAAARVVGDPGAARATTADGAADASAQTERPPFGALPATGARPAEAAEHRAADPSAAHGASSAGVPVSPARATDGAQKSSPAARPTAAPAADRPRAARRAERQRAHDEDDDDLSVDAWLGAAPRGLGIAGTARKPGAPGTHVVAAGNGARAPAQRIVRHVGVATRSGIELAGIRGSAPAAAAPAAPAVRHVGVATRNGIESASSPQPSRFTGPSDPSTASARPVVRVSLAQAAAAGRQTLRTASPTAASPVARQAHGDAPAKQRARREPPPVDPLALPNAEDSILFAVEGLGSPACANRVERALRSVAGVQAVDVNLAAGIVAVAPAHVDRGAVEAALEAAGHPPRSGAPDAASHRRIARSLALGAGLTAALGVAAEATARLTGSSVAATIVAATALASAFRVVLPACRHALRLRPAAELLPVAAALAVLVAAQVAPDGSPSLAAFPLAAHLAIAALGARAGARALEAIERVRAALPDGPAPAAVGRLEVAPGQVVPIDGRLVRAAVVDERPVGGDEDVERLAGELVVAGVRAPEGALLEIPQAGTGRRIARGLQIAERALATRPVRTPIQIASTLVVPGALAAAVVAAIFGGPWGAAAVLAAAAPAALGLAAALAAAAGMSRAAARGVAVRSSEALERAASVEAVLFDRASLTRGDAAVLDLLVKPGRDPRTVLAAAAAVERGLDDGIARAIAAHAADLRLPVPAASDRRIAPGGGVSARVDGALVRVGSARHLADQGIDAGILGPTLLELASRGRIPLLVAIDDEAVGVLGIAETPRESARQAMGSLELLGVNIHLASADATPSVQWLAQAIGLDGRLARGELGADEKKAFVDELRAYGPCLVVVGAGSDAALMPAADLAVAAAGGPLEEAAGAVLMRPDPQGVVELLRAGRAARRGRRLATVAGVGGNLAAIGLALTGAIGVGGAAALSLLTSLLTVGAAASPWIRVR